MFGELSVEGHLAQRQCVHACDALRVVSLSLFEHHRHCATLMTDWVCRWKPFWIPSGDTFQKAYLEEWEHVNDEQRHVLVEDKPHPISRATESAKLQKAGKDEKNTTREPPCDVPSSPKSSWQAVGESEAPTWKYTVTLESAVFWEPLGAPLLPKNRVCNFIHPKQFGPLPKRLILSYPDEEILSGYEEDVSSIRNGFSARLKTDFVTTLSRHTVHVAAFREAPARKHSTSCQEYHFNNDMPNRLTEQKRLSVYNWKPGPRRGKEGAIVKHIAEKWHIITLQEAIWFHMTHCGGCAILFTKDTFFTDIKVTSIYLHDLKHFQPAST